MENLESTLNFKMLGYLFSRSIFSTRCAMWCCASFVMFFLFVAFAFLMFQVRHFGDHLAKYYGYFGLCVGDACGV